jgi:Co/Zn/Cd efflux system component
MSQPAGTVSGLAVASLVCGILAFFVFGIVLGILAIIFGGVALSKIRKNPEVSGRGMAIAGLVLGIVATVVTALYLAR